VTKSQPCLEALPGARTGTASRRVHGPGHGRALYGLIQGEGPQGPLGVQCPREPCLPPSLQSGWLCCVPCVPFRLDFQGIRTDGLLFRVFGPFPPSPHPPTVRPPLTFSVCLSCLSVRYSIIVLGASFFARGGDLFCPFARFIYPSRPPLRGPDAHLLSSLPISPAIIIIIDSSFVPTTGSIDNLSRFTRLTPLSALLVQTAEQ
jgi:hypothetical protein